MTGSGDDLIDGGSGNDNINAGDGDNEVYGGSGNDRIMTGSGQDLVYGGDGNDQLRTGAGDDEVYGGAGKDLIFAGAGNDTIDGGAGADNMAGGAGDDTYYVDIIKDLVREKAGEGIDTIVSDMSFNLSKLVNVENLTLSDAVSKLDIDAIGNASDNVLMRYRDWETDRKSVV